MNKTESILRYKYDKDYNYKGFDYINFNDNSFSLKTIMNANGNPVTLYETPTKQMKFIDSEDQLNKFLMRSHKLSFYKNYLSNKSREQKALRIKKDFINVIVNKTIDLKIDLGENESAVEYNDNISIYNRSTSKKVREIRLINNGIVLYGVDKDSQFETIIFDKDGNEIIHNTFDNFTKPKFINPLYIEPLSLLPQKAILNNDEISLEYDDYGLLKSDIGNYTIYGTKESNNSKIYYSAHPIYFDNFNFENYFTGYEDKWVIEGIIIYSNGDLEYTNQVVTNSNKEDIKDFL